MQLVYVSSVKKKWDQLGLGLSGLCLIHCFALALLPLILPFTQHHFDLWFHGLMSFIVTFTAWQAFAPSYRLKGWKVVHLLGLIAVIFLNLGLGLEFFSHHFAGHLFTVSGSSLLISAHLMNIYSSRK